jgi:hypothetical protein
VRRRAIRLSLGLPLALELALDRFKELITKRDQR